MTDPHTVCHSSKSVDWMTSAAIVDSVIETLEVIDIDPCGESHERPNVPARTIYTTEEGTDGQ